MAGELLPMVDVNEQQCPTGMVVLLKAKGSRSNLWTLMYQGLVRMACFSSRRMCRFLVNWVSRLCSSVQQEKQMCFLQSLHWR